jgi:hypothetical protein
MVVEAALSVLAVPGGAADTGVQGRSAQLPGAERKTTNARLKEQEWISS